MINLRKTVLIWFVFCFILRFSTFFIFLVSLLSREFFVSLFGSSESESYFVIFLFSSFSFIDFKCFYMFSLFTISRDAMFQAFPFLLSLVLCRPATLSFFLFMVNFMSIFSFAFIFAFVLFNYSPFSCRKVRCFHSCLASVLAFFLFVSLTFLKLWRWIFYSSSYPPSTYMFSHVLFCDPRWLLSSCRHHAWLKFFVCLVLFSFV